jgi:hypothetical protein
MKISVLIILFTILIAPSAFPQDPVAVQAPDHLLNQLIRQVKASITAEQQYGYFQNVEIRKLDGNGKTSSLEKRVYRTVWIDGHPYNELRSINGASLSPTQRHQELKRRSEFIKSIRSNSDRKGVYQELQKVPWTDLYGAYRFTLASSMAGPGCILNFEPSGAKIRERSRFQKLLQHLSGNIVLDEARNVMEAHGRLIEPVRFGLGIVAKVEELEIHYRQQPHEGVWGPASLFLRFKARIALLKTERQEIRINWYNPFPRPLLTTADSTLPHTHSAPREK